MERVLPSIRWHPLCFFRADTEGKLRCTKYQNDMDVFRVVSNSRFLFDYNVEGWLRHTVVNCSKHQVVIFYRLLRVETLPRGETVIPGMIGV